MTEIRFYHLMTRGVEEALPGILTKALEQGRRAVIRLPDENSLKKLDDLLWTAQADSFIPHGSAADGHAADQPLWLTLADENPNRADILILTGGAQSEHLKSFTLCCVMVDGRDDDLVQKSRDHWKIYKDQGFDLTYWQQNDRGGWEKKAA